MIKRQWKGGEKTNPSTSSFPIPPRPHTLQQASRILGDLLAIDQDEDCIIATFGCRCHCCGSPYETRIAFPESLEAELRQFLGRDAGVTRMGDRYIVRGLEADEKATVEASCTP